VLAYILFMGCKRLACPAAWAPQTNTTVLWKLVQVADRILRHAGRVVLRLVLDAGALPGDAASDCGAGHWAWRPDAQAR
jgi:hypothetical protein